MVGCPSSITRRLARLFGEIPKPTPRDVSEFEKLDLDHRGRRYFVHTYEKSPAVRRFLLSNLMAQIAKATLGETVYLFNEQYVVKAAERGMKFGWHQPGTTRVSRS